MNTVCVIDTIDVEENGTLILYHPRDVVKAVFAPGTWDYCGEPLPTPVLETYK